MNHSKKVLTVTCTTAGNELIQFNESRLSVILFCESSKQLQSQKKTKSP